MVASISSWKMRSQGTIESFPTTCKLKDIQSFFGRLKGSGETLGSIVKGFSYWNRPTMRHVHFWKWTVQMYPTHLLHAISPRCIPNIRSSWCHINIRLADGCIPLAFQSYPPGRVVSYSLSLLFLQRPIGESSDDYDQLWHRKFAAAGSIWNVAWPPICKCSSTLRLINHGWKIHELNGGFVCWDKS